MKKLRVFLAAILVALPLMAQQVSVTTVTPNTLQDSQIASFDADGTRTFDVRNGATRHQLTFRSSGTISAPTTVTISCKGDTNNNFSQVGTSALLNDTIVWYGTVSLCRVVVTGFTGSGSIDAWYFGDSPTSRTVGLTGAPFNELIGSIDDALKVHVAGTSSVNGGIADGSPAGQSTPVVVGGVDSSGNVQRVLTDTGGALQVDIESGSTVATTCTSSTCASTVVGAAADGASTSGNPVLIAGATGSTAQT